MSTWTLRSAVFFGGFCSTPLQILVCLRMLCARVSDLCFAFSPALLTDTNFDSHYRHNTRHDARHHTPRRKLSLPAHHHHQHSRCRHETHAHTHTHTHTHTNRVTRAPPACTHERNTHTRRHTRERFDRSPPSRARVGALLTLCRAPLTRDAPSRSGWPPRTRPRRRATAPWSRWASPWRTWMPPATGASSRQSRPLRRQ